MDFVTCYFVSLEKSRGVLIKTGNILDTRLSLFYIGHWRTFGVDILEMGKHLASLQSHMSANSRISDYMVSYNFRTTGKKNSHLSYKTNPIRYTCRTNLIFTSIWYGIFSRPSRALELLFKT